MKYVCLILLLLVSGMAYRPALSAGFVYEDHAMRDYRAVTGGFVPRPSRWLSTLTFRAQEGQSAVAFHAVNLGLHLVNGLLLFLLAQQIGLTTLKDGAVAAAGLLLLYPLNSEAVSYVAARPDLLAACFVLLSLNCAVRDWSWAAGLCAVGAMLSKESGIVVVPLLIWIGVPNSLRWGWGLLVLWLCVASGLPLAWALWRTTSGPWLLPQLAAIGAQLGHLWPFALISPDPDIGGWSLPWQLVGASGVAAFVCVWSWADKVPALRFCLTWTVICLGVRLLVPTPGNYLNPHQMYLPAIGLWLALGACWGAYAGKRAYALTDSV